MDEEGMADMRSDTDGDTLDVGLPTQVLRKLSSWLVCLCGSPLAGKACSFSLMCRAWPQELLKHFQSLWFSKYGGLRNLDSY